MLLGVEGRECKWRLDRLASCHEGLCRLFSDFFIYYLLLSATMPERKGRRKGRPFASVPCLSGAGLVLARLTGCFSLFYFYLYFYFCPKMAWEGARGQEQGEPCLGRKSRGRDEEQGEPLVDLSSSRFFPLASRRQRGSDGRETNPGEQGEGRQGEGLGFWPLVSHWSNIFSSGFYFSFWSAGKRTLAFFFVGSSAPLSGGDAQRAQADDDHEDETPAEEERCIRHLTCLQCCR